MRPDMHSDAEALIESSSLDALLQLDAQHPALDDMHLFACRMGNISYCISFDLRDPADGWRASWQREGQKTVHLRKSFSTREDAAKALKQIARRHAS
jgi:hypothetical protein